MYYNNQNSLQSTSIPNLLEGKERFFRPSKDPVLFNPFTFQKIKNENISSFSSSEEIIYGFFGILEEAANLDNNPNIGCGTVGNVKEPYPYAYELLSSTKKKSLSYHEFIHLFLGICHISFLKIFQAYVPPDTPPNVNYYMYEIEVITGFPITTSDIKPPGLGLFGYYYGVIKVVYEKKTGWKIDDALSYPENYLCAPYHGWSYDAMYVMNLIFKESLEIIDTIESYSLENNLITIYSSKGNTYYKFVFVRLTNGTDTLLHQYIMIHNQWMETNFLTGLWKNLFTLTF